MDNRAALDRVAELVGIETSYTDALGDTRIASDESLASIISVFGLPADPIEAVRLLEENKRSAPFGLGSVHLVHAEGPRPSLPMEIPAGTGEIAWSCHLENGELKSGRFGAQPAPAAMPLPSGLPLGYHRLVIEADSIRAELDLIVTPANCYLPPQLGEGKRSWGLTCQLYGLRSAHDWGMGDFTDLAEIASAAGAAGAAVLGINPLHALFAAEPLHFSPYSPSSRTWLDYLYIDPAAVPGFAEDDAVQNLVRGEWFGATQSAAQSAKLIDYGAVAAAKAAVLDALYQRFRTLDLGEGSLAQTSRGQCFRRFQQAGGQSLRDLAVFEVLHEFYCRRRNGFSWRSWPEPMRQPRSPEVTAFAAAHRERVEFFQFLQWEADRQLAAAARLGRSGGLSIGFYRDLAVGANPNGADAWADQSLIAPQAAIGAPPDALSRRGQNWGLAPINPIVLRRQRFAPFIDCLRANMRHAGILRIDHVMSLKRLYWIPYGMEATEGCYVNYPFDDLLRLVALESHRQNCAVVGEDLGTVPPGFRETMRSANVLSYRIMVFERKSDGSFIRPNDYPPLAVASAATHDLATLEGFWLGRDIAWRRELGLYPDANAEAAEIAERVRDRQLLLDALVLEGLLAREQCSQFLSEGGLPIYGKPLGDAIQRYLARSSARLMLVQIEDLIGETEQANLPGTTDAHPNWRRRLSQDLGQIIYGGELHRLAVLVEQERQLATAA